MADIGVLKQIDWLEELGDADWQRLATRGRRISFAAGATVFEPASAPESVYLIERGLVRIFRLSASGDEATLGFVPGAEVFGELAGFGDYPRESFAVAAAPSVIWTIPVDLFRDLLSSRPRFANHVSRQMGERMKLVESRVESLVFRDVRSRMAIALLELARDFGSQDGERVILELQLTQSELATLVGASRQSVNAAIARFREEGLIERDGHRLVLLSPANLRAVSTAESAS